MNIDSNRYQNAIRCNLSYGPIFGGCEITIANNPNTTMDSYSFLGSSYKHPQYAKGTNEAKTFMAGSYKFQLDEIEVYEKE
jgi:hypothetical protein